MVHYDPFAEQNLADPYPIYRTLRDEAPVYYVEEFDSWFLSRFEDIWNVNSDFRALSNANGTTPGQLLTKDTAINPSLASMDPPRHSKFRGLIAPHFKPGAVKKLEPQVRGFARGALDAFLDRGECDILNEYAARIAIQVVCLFGGLPVEKTDTMLGWVNDIFDREAGHRGLTEAGHRSAREMFFYLLDHVKQQRKDPDKAGGLLKLLLTTDLEGGLSDPDVTAYLTLLLIGGTDTFPKSFTNTVVRLWEHPDQRARVVADPNLGASAFEESLRHRTPTQMLGRTLVRDVALHGETMREGQKVMFLFASANRDEREFEDPDSFDIDRSRPRTLAFGHGPHVCLGAHVARLEARVGLEELFARIGDYDVDLDNAEWLHTEFVQGYKNLPLRFELR